MNWNERSPSDPRPSRRDRSLSPCWSAPDQALGTDPSRWSDIRPPGKDFGCRRGRDRWWRSRRRGRWRVLRATS